MSFEPLYTWFLEQINYIVIMIVLGLMAWCAFKRAWIMAFSVLIVGAIIGIFIWNPTMLKNISEWFGGMFGL
ncbi:hypothetical protein ABD87_14750 [Lysinibacillus sphaericus]|uniref:TcpD family membrane protein n=1 Tax=Lysinibacillus sphaericus TaxID=1421 RepID=UPI0018CD6D85|nr:TcpD family membrane protein [Lysinibacillus sphaericus]MBG9730758.1 hypothetical protein [Lysinibacillus sphaericus]